MKFVKLHQHGVELFVNLSLVSEIYPVEGIYKSDLYLNGNDGEQVSFRVDESVDEILYLSKQADEIIYNAKQAIENN